MNKNEQIKCDVFSCIHNCDCCCSLDSKKYHATVTTNMHQKRKQYVIALKRKINSMSINLLLLYIYLLN